MAVDECILIVIVSVCVCWSTAVDITVLTNVGNITGSIEDVNVGPNIVKISTYLGIPFAEPPTGSLRFAKPQPKPKFNENFLARNYSASCHQFKPFWDTRTDNDYQNEDCLYLNVFSPDIDQSGKRYPVLIWIHGGSFLMGSGKGATSNILAAYGQVIIVSINYRLGVFGFLSSGNSAAGGNYGLWDQHLAIEWVKNNIVGFGGDTTKITIFGESAGSATVMFQAIYPGNENLFQRVIAESGSANANWAITKDPASKLKQYSARLNCTRSSLEQTVACLKSIKNPTEMTMKSDLTFSAGLLDWCPTIDNDFITKERIEALNNPARETQLTYFNQLDLIMGTNRFESDQFLLNAPEYESTFINGSASITDTEVAIRAVIFRSLSRRYHPDLVQFMLAEVLFQYNNFKNSFDKNMYMQQLENFVTDVEFFVPTYKALESHAYDNISSKTYQYEFNQLNPFRPHHPWMTGAVHGDELKYVFGSVYKMSQNETQPVRNTEWSLAKTLMTYWTNFAKSG
ncbi:cholinesterase 1 [Patella vulgata]|uniref:cholinesterase 1 n=1 Tax=Patella vulgata TaxID=6465 RepID=UPI0024A8E1C5|nr:cholinesterase 1 [Patella vulgata]